jgi:rubredoxin
MKQYIRCKACGYIMEAGKVGDLCPACGVPAKAFEPYKETISEQRKRILDLHIHPIVVHLAQAIAPMLLVLAAALAIIGEGPLRTALLAATRVLAAFLPFAVVLAFAAGLIDGRLRFRKVTTPLLKRKILIGILFFAASLASAALALFTGIEGAIVAPFILVQVLSLAAAVILGYSGFGLVFSRFPG